MTVQLGKYFLTELSKKDETEIVRFFAHSADFARLTSGKSEPEEDFLTLINELPEGKNPADKIVFGLVDKSGKVLAVIDLLRDFPEDGEWMIGLLEILPELRGKGLGKELHTEIVAFAKKAGAKSLRIGVFLDNPQALKFWESLGYQTFKQVKLTFGEKNHETAVMRRKIW
ncbi:GNAT family N-acetyltransferase [Lactococcus nasutitermitis]|uniref:GNAT family N-acetyltransferase n=1 Tax=Lactococcus nasutitermitis TaxID=1652957 RepID=A0ABV9JDI6_9LACT|nr:GNAT family N-acetyltransferase [Lactococcus nasutitermitis]